MYLCVYIYIYLLGICTFSEIYTGWTAVSSCICPKVCVCSLFVDYVCTEEHRQMDS